MPQETEVIDQSLTTAISKAVETHKEDLTQDRSDVEVQREEQKEEKEEKITEVVHAEADIDAENGKILIQALRDPTKAGAVIDYLATQAGYTKANIQNKTDVKEAKQDIEAILERNLGEEFKFLAPKLAPAIKESLENLLQGHDPNSDIRARLEKQELREIQTETAQTHTSLAQEWFGSDDMPAKVINAMSSAMDEFPPTDPNMTPERYYRRIFSLVVGELGLTKKNQDQSGRIKRNMDDSAARNLTSQNRGVSPNIGGNPRKLSLKDSVALALEQVEQSSRK